MIAQIFIPAAELALPTGIPTSKANAKIETQAETKTRKCSNNLKSYGLIYAFHSLNRSYLEKDTSTL